MIRYVQPKYFCNGEKTYQFYAVSTERFYNDSYEDDDGDHCEIEKHVYDLTNDGYSFDLDEECATNGYFYLPCGDEFEMDSEDNYTMLELPLTHDEDGIITGSIIKQKIENDLPVKVRKQKPNKGRK